MPLQYANTESAFKHNIAAEIEAGKSKEQAAAIAYSIKRGEDEEKPVSNRFEDINGYVEIKDNPISKVGVFPYLGRSISAELEPDRVYMVYRPAEELSHPDCINSFKLIPWIEGHVMLGAESQGLTPAEQKGVQGVIGEDVYFKDDTLYGNLKLFSNSLGEIIDSGAARELSCGYRCKYVFSSGIWNNQSYTVIQTNIRGNHLASVPEGRMGSDVAVLDQMNFTFDAKDFNMPEEIKEEVKKEEVKDEASSESSSAKEMSLSEITAKLEEIIPEVQKLMGFMNKLKPLEEEEHGEALDEDEEKKEEKEEEKKDEGKAMDAQDVMKGLLREVAQRDALAAKLSDFVGTFDHAEKTLAEVAQYGISKLGIECPAGQEISALNGFLHNRQAPSKSFGFAADSKQKGVDSLENFYAPKQ